MSSSDLYFAAAAGEPTDPGRYVDRSEIDPVQFLEGLEFRPVLGERLLVNFVRFEPNTVVPRHAHAEEQVTLVVEGEFEFDLDGDVRVMRPGMVAVIPPWVPHAARTHDTTCFQIDVFSPPREVLVQALRERGPD